MLRCLEPYTGTFIYLNTNEEGIKSIVLFSLLSLVLSFLSSTLNCMRLLLFQVNQVHQERIPALISYRLREGKLL